jgi:hypothetical protein
VLIELVRIYFHSEVFRNLHKWMSAHHPHLRCPSVCTEDLWQRKIGIDSEVGGVVEACHISNKDRRPISNVDVYDLLILLPFCVRNFNAKLVDTEVSDACRLN